MGLNIILRLLPSVNFQKFVLDITSINGFPDCSQDVLTQVASLTRTSSLWIWSFLLVHTDPVRVCPLVTVSLEVTLARQGLISESIVLVCSIYTAELSVGKLDRIWTFCENGIHIYYHGFSGWWETESLVIREAEQCRLIMVPLSTTMAANQDDLHFSLGSCQELVNIFFSLHPK